MLHQKVSQFNNPLNFKGESLRKTEASSSKHLISNRSRIAVSNTSQNQHLLSQCYSIISAQQAHINKLEKDNERKDKIMASILNKGDLRKINNESTKNGISTMQIEKISEQLQHLYRNYDKLLHENEVLRTQLMEKDKYVLKINQQIGEARQREVDLKEQLQKCKESVAKLKLAYENKISKLLGEFRNNIQKDIEYSKIKNLQFNHEEHCESQRKYQNQLKKYAKYEQNGWSPARKLNQGSEKKNFTPLKSQKQNLSFENSERQTRGTKNWVIEMQQKSNNIDTDIKKLINTPYRKPNSDFIYSSSKAFPTASTKISQLQSTDVRKVRNKKMLENVKDAQFSVQHYQSSQNSQAEQGSGNSDITEEQSNEKASKIMNKISVQQIVRKFSEYYNKYECQNAVNSDRKAEQKQCVQFKKPEIINERERGDKQFSRIKWNNILEELSRRIKKFESPHQQNMQFYF